VHYSGWDAKNRCVNPVSSYTITEPHPNGKSISTEQHKGKLFIDPVRHRDSFEGPDDHYQKMYHDYYTHRNIDEHNHNRKVTDHFSKQYALDRIAHGDVVRHVGEDKISLLHHNLMTPTQARIRANDHDYAYDMTRTAEGNKIQRTQAKVNHDRHGLFPQPLKEHEKVEMHERLAKNMQEGQQHAKADKTVDKLYWNEKKRIAEPDKDREAHLAALKKMKKVSVKEKKAASPTPPESIK
jgi:hypothetical protein